MAQGRMTRWSRALGIWAAAGLLIVGLTTSPVLAAKVSHGGGGHKSGGTSTLTGNDVSYPQCGGSLPSSPAFGIVGVNSGLANDLSACLGPTSRYPSYAQSELYWAVASSTGVAPQPKASLYVNTGDPGNLYNGTPITDWPTSGTNPDGTCTTSEFETNSGLESLGQQTAACAWQYGYNKAAQDANWLSAAATAIDAQKPPVPVALAPAAYPWWLDVETGNSWQSGSTGQLMNVADLQGMIAAFQTAGVTALGVYSTSAQWVQITGGTTAESGSLYGLPDWIPGANRLSGAVSNCQLHSFTEGRVQLTQWSGHPFDGDFACG